MTQAAVPAMRARRWGRIVAITSMTVRQPSPTLILSNTARGRGDGVPQDRRPRGGRRRRHGQHRAARACTAPTGIRHLYGDRVDRAADGIPAGVIGEADDFGAAVAFLCSEQAKFITGVGLHIDGGSFAGLQ